MRCGASRSSPRSRITTWLSLDRFDACINSIIHGKLRMHFLFSIANKCSLHHIKRDIVYMEVLYYWPRLLTYPAQYHMLLSPHHFQWRSCFSSFQYTWLSSSRQCHLVAFQRLCRWETERGRSVGHSGVLKIYLSMVHYFQICCLSGDTSALGSIYSYHLLFWGNYINYHKIIIAFINFGFSSYI